MFLQSDKPPTIPRGAGTDAEPETDGSATHNPSSSSLSGTIQCALSLFLGQIKLFFVFFVGFFFSNGKGRHLLDASSARLKPHQFVSV